MKIRGRKEPVILFLGDFFFFLISLWLALFLRNFELPDRELFLTHLKPFVILSLAWVSVFYISGLYGKPTLILKSKLPSLLFNAQVINSGLAVLFFYFIPFFGITPKTILFIYLFVSFCIILVWRRYGYFLLAQKRSENAILIGSGEEMRELYKEVNNNSIYNLRFISFVDLSEVEDNTFWDEIVSRVYAENVSVIAIDLTHEKVEPILPHLYNLIFSRISFIDMNKIYEDIFDRVPLSLLKYNWFLENITNYPRATYDALKRIMDIVISFISLLVTGPFFPLIALVIKLEGPGPAFITQDRIGERNHIVRLLKFRSMKVNDKGEWPKEGDERITRVGAFLRKSRIDELPQLWNVLKGDISLVGPRPDIVKLGLELIKAIPYYNVRNVIKPGLSGWAQINQDIVPHSVEDTRHRLAYDLYYIKNRSFLLDLKIALSTIKTLVSRVGR